MKRNIEKQADLGQKLLQENRGYDLNMSEIKELMDEYIEKKDLYGIIVKTFCFGVAVGSRAKGGK